MTSLPDQLRDANETQQMASSPTGHQTRRSARASTRGRGAVTSEERDRAPAATSADVAIEAQAHSEQPQQLALIDPLPRGRATPKLGGLAPLDSHSSLTLARSWYRRELEQAQRPKNTIESYSYDLQAFEILIGPKPLFRIDRADIARYLGAAETRSTRKRRLTTARRFFRYLIEGARVLRIDPTEGFFPHQISLRTPVPLFGDEQEALVQSADIDERWSVPAILLMMRLGLTRGELLGLREGHIDREDPDQPVVFIGFESVAKRGRERRLATSPEILTRLDQYIEETEPIDRLFPVGPPAVNAMVERVRRRAGIVKTVTPQTLRATFAIERARRGADTQQLLDLLGLVDDPRNRASVDRYIEAALPALPTE